MRLERIAGRTVAAMLVLVAVALLMAVFWCVWTLRFKKKGPPALPQADQV